MFFMYLVSNCYTEEQMMMFCCENLKAASKTNSAAFCYSLCLKTTDDQNLHANEVKSNHVSKTLFRGYVYEDVNIPK